MVRLTDRPDMTLDVYRGRKTTIQQQQRQVLGKSKSEIVRVTLSFAYNLVIDCGEKSGARVLRVRFFSLFNRHKLLSQREISNTVLSYPYHLLSTTLNLLSICKSTMLNKYPVPLFGYLQGQVRKSGYRKAESVLVKNEHIEYMYHTVISTPCFVYVNAANV